MRFRRPRRKKQLSGPYAEDERRRLSTLDLIGLAAGGVIGSGWLLSATDVWQTAGRNAVWAWLIGGVTMLVVAIVMVELATDVPRTGGLIFLPLQSSGPLLATIVAAALWLTYALNSASEAAAMVKGLGTMHVLGLALPPAPGQQAFDVDALTARGLLFAALFLAAILAVNLLARRLFVRFNFALTLWKIVIPVLIIALLIKASQPVGHGTCASGGDVGSGSGFFGILTAVTSGGVVYAYLGFQAPLDFAGNVRRHGSMAEAARLRWSVYGTILGATTLYVFLQVALLHLFDIGLGLNCYAADSPYAHFALALSLGWLAPLIRVDALLSPMGSGLVYTHALTREVAALSRAHLTHRGLQIARRASLRLGGWEIDVFWLVLVVDFVIGLLALLAVGGRWGVLASLISILELVLYTMAGIVLVSIQPHLSGGRAGRRMVLGVVSRVGFVATGLLLYWAAWPNLWRGMVGLAIGCVVLLGLPILAQQDLPLLGRVLRRYDAKEYATMFRRDFGKAPARAAVWLAGYLVALTLLDLLRSVVDPSLAHPNLAWEIPAGLLVVVLALIVFQRLVTLSRRHMAEVPPTL